MIAFINLFKLEAPPHKNFVVACRKAKKQHLANVLYIIHIFCSKEKWQLTNVVYIMRTQEHLFKGAPIGFQFKGLD